MLQMNSIELKKFRDKHNLSQQELAEIVKKTIRAVQSWEQGTRNMPESVMVILENYEKKPQGGSGDVTDSGDIFNEDAFENWKIDDKLNEIYKFQLAKLTIQDQDLRFLNKKVDDLNEEMKNIKEILINLVEKNINNPKVKA